MTNAAKSHGKKKPAAKAPTLADVNKAIAKYLATHQVAGPSGSNGDSACPPPPAKKTVWAIANLGNMDQQNTYFVYRIAINHDGTITDPAGGAGSGTGTHDVMTLEGITYRVR